MAWYDDKKKLTHVVTYKSDKDAAKEMDKAAQKGWMPQETTASEGDVRFGRTLAKGVLTGGIGLLVGGRSRGKDKITITYVRTPQWLEANAKK